jgi:hypothetical protein
VAGPALEIGPRDDAEPAAPPARGGTMAALFGRRR